MTSPSGQRRTRETARGSRRRHASRHQHLLPRGRAGDRRERRGRSQDRAARSELGNYVVLEDNYGNRFTYAELGRVARAYPVARDATARGRGPRPTRNADMERGAAKATEPDRRRLTEHRGPRERLFAFPDRQGAPRCPSTPQKRRSSASDTRASSASSGPFGSIRSEWSSAGSRRAPRWSQARSSARSDRAAGWRRT